MLQTAKSVIKGEPIILAHEFNADTPGINSTCKPFFGSHPDSANTSKINPAIP